MVPASSIIKKASSPDSTGASSALPPAVTQQFVRELACEAGFTEAGIVGLPHAQSERDAKRFTEFIDQGRAGNMAYLARRDEKNELLRSRIDLPFPWARSVVVCMASYHAAAPLSTAAAKAGAGWIARYAWSGKTNEKGETRPSDYHKVLLKRLRALEAELHAAFGDFECRAFVDTGPIVERAAARAAGLGWTGKNTCLIHPKAGSWNFLAVLVTSLEVPAEAAPLAVPDRCGSCRRCLDACPTQALIEPYQMDATRCIAYLTIEHHGEIEESLRPGMGRQIFGCDICQDVCPWNRKAPIGREDSELHPREELVNPDLGWLAGLELADYERIFNGSPVRRAGFWGLRRNIAIAMGNSGLRRFVPWLERWAEPYAEALMDSGPDTGSRADLDRAAARDSARWALEQFAHAQQEPERGSKSFSTK
ncbi:MAG TPA: tRNA epoxyqueuosine(34) reductase QueG [Acidobacteriaceae bacterium]|jgi:epoxyqueuosine reductase|nr:tRNA epoxyqueuosine(34) reductase QueG [Acidobacteriaceae bacterium]